MSLKTYLAQSATLLQTTLQDEPLNRAVELATGLMIDTLSRQDPVLICGNGGSACDALHIAGELVGRFLKERKALNVIALSDNVAILTALANDYSYDYVFSRQVEAYGKTGGLLIGLSTSGNSANVVKAFETARQRGLKTIAFTGAKGGALAPLSDALIAVPSSHVPHIQQVHMCLYHHICEAIEAHMFENDKTENKIALYSVS